MQAINQYKLRQCIILLLLAALIFFAGLNGNLIETFYSNGLYAYTSVAQRFISSFVPFPTGDVLYLVFLFYVFRSLYLFLKKIIKRQLKQSDFINTVLQFFNFTLILYLIFKLLWGLNYSRLPVAEQLGIDNKKYTTIELLALGNFLVNQINRIQTERAAVPGYANVLYTADELQAKAVASYQELSIKNNLFKYRQPAMKAVLNSWIITKIGLEGYYNPLSGEANVNMMLNPVNLPFVTCHEISHQLGIGREDEANLIGYLATTSSSDLNFKYSGNYCVLRSVLFEIAVQSPDDYEALRNKINATTLEDYKKDKEFWRGYNSDMYGYMDVALDRFLKLNNQHKGTDSYQDIVIWLYNLHKKEIALSIQATP